MRYILALLAIALPLRFALVANDSPSAAALLGTWSGTEQLPNGTKMSLQMKLEPGMKFSGTVAVNGNVVWEYSGSWSLAGNTLTWNYEKSSNPLPEAAKVDVDQIVSINPKRLVLLSKQSGKQHEFQRTP